MSNQNESKTRLRVIVVSVAALLALIYINQEDRARAEIIISDSPKPEEAGITIEMLDRLPGLPGDLSMLPPIYVSGSKELAKIELGKMLFFDKRLSLDNSMSCSTCHDPAKGFADGRPRAIGFGGKELGRHSPTILNAAHNLPQFWDGRASGLEEQAQGPIRAAAEMNMDSEVELVARLDRVAEYRSRFSAIFGEGPSFKNIASSIAAFERTLVTPGSRFDRYARGDKNALTEDEKKGLILFIGRASCSQCHNGPNFTDNKFHSLGTPQKGPSEEDLGRYMVTKDDKDKWAFKTPTLRNVTVTAPYMHDGAFATLDEVVDFYDEGCGSAPNKSDLIFKLNLTNQEKRYLVAFIKALTGEMPAITVPELPGDDPR